jgi:iron(III) transport system ATP-binding protein
MVVAGPNRRFVPAEERGIGIVFQNYALWPHMSVARNVGYALEVRGLRGLEYETRVKDALRTVGLEDYGTRRPAELSGGQRQRVALARCLAMAPRLVLLDEPLANLDVHLRASLQDEFQDLHRKTGATMVYVTHDQAEAMALADRIAVMAQGRIVQIASPHLLYREPASPMVAGFVGRGGLVQARLSTGVGADGKAVISLLGYAATVRGRPGQAAGPVQICLRPEDLRIAGPRDGGFSVACRRTLYQGGRIAAEMVPEGQEGTLLTLILPPEGAPEPGARLKLQILDGWVVPEAAAVPQDKD